MIEVEAPPVSITVLGAGNRGSGYARWALTHPDRARVVAVAERNPIRRERFARDHQIRPELVHSDWRQLLDEPQLSDVVIIATQDQHHVEPALALLQKGYHVLLEKPLAPTEEECRAIADAAERSGRIFAVCHVLLYAPHTRLVKSIVDSGRLGTLVSVQHLEPVGYWHQAHSYVRGNWRRQDQSTFMLMAKSSHDIDWLQHIMGQAIVQVSSFGGLRHFRPENAPAGAAARCVDCPLQKTCPYSATRIYNDLLDAGQTGWPIDTIVENSTREELAEALGSGPYGRCVYFADNDVVDHQVVAMEFEDGASGVFTMTGFNAGGHRRTRIFGTLGELVTDGERVEVYEFGASTTEVLTPQTTGDATADGGHGGGDAGLMDAFTHAVATGDTTGIFSDAAHALSSHLAVFAAERARNLGSVQSVIPVRT